MAKYEKPQPRNPHRLTIVQHRIPVRSIQRFARADRKVDVHLERRRLAAKPTDALFAAKRAWDQRSERGFMKTIEDEYQIIADRIFADPRSSLSETEFEAITAYFCLWYHRSRVVVGAMQDATLKGVAGGRWSQDEQEQLEKAGVSFIREDGTIPARNFVGLRLQKDIPM